MAVSKRLRFEVLRRDNHTCRYCGAKSPDVKLTVDHVTPVALGGRDEATNLVTACGPCNSGKSSINPGDQLVADVQQDAMRWQVAWHQAVTEAEHDGAQRAKNVAKVKKNYVAAYRGRHGENPILPEGWEASVGRWLDLGLPVDLIDRAIASAVGRDHIRADKRWNYFAGCCWNMLRELADRTQQIADATATPPETWAEKVKRTVLDTAVLIWTDMYMSSEGRDPSAEDLALLRENAESLFPEEVSPGALLHAAWTVAEWGSTDLTQGLDADDYTNADPFHVSVAKWHLVGWTQRENAAGNVLTPELHADLLRQACAARDAGYWMDIVYSAAHTAGRYGGSLIEALTTAESSLRTNAEYYEPEIARCALTQEELDRIADEAWKDKARRDRRSAEVGKWGDDRNAVTNAASHNEGGC